MRTVDTAVAWHRRHDTTRRRRVHPIAWLLSQLRGSIWRRHVRGRLDADDVRHAFSQIDLLLTCMIGMIRDDILWKGFDVVDDIDFRSWLTCHGAQPTTLDGPDVRAVYDEVFAVSVGPSTTADGDERYRRSGPGLAAGAALYSMVRTQLPYRGSVMWQATGGMGDTAIVPMYQTLVQRGVDVRFFQHVVNLGVDPASRIVDRIEIVQQARPKGRYEPLVDVKGLPCWPGQPRWDQLEDGDQLAAAAISFELGEAEPGAQTTTLRAGADFDTVVLAISAAALPTICGEIMDASPAFAKMLAHTHTTMTQAFQLWLTVPPSELGFQYGHAVTSCFVEPVDTAADNSQVLWSEDWTSGGTPSSVWYFCGVLPEDERGDDPAWSDERVRTSAYAYLDAVGALWPGATTQDGFRWDLLASPSAVQGPDRLSTQYLRANATPTERYVQTPPGSTRHRLGADESGLANLFLAGDWTRNGMDVGAVEATVTSGMLAARAISGSPARIAWERAAWMVDG